MKWSGETEMTCNLTYVPQSSRTMGCPWTIESCVSSSSGRALHSQAEEGDGLKIHARNLMEGINRPDCQKARS
jgi:hypothetical protein